MIDSKTVLSAGNEPTVAQLKRVSDERWKKLPSVIRATFECTRKVSISQSLKVLGVEAPGTRQLEWVYETSTGRLVVTVWHDRIERGADGTLTYLIDALEWQAGSRRVQNARAVRMRELLGRHAGQEVYVLLLKRGWDANDTQRAERNAPDIRTWMLEDAGETRFVLRRPMLRRAA